VSPYRWPRRRKSPDRSARRHAWQTGGSGPVTEAAVLAARRSRAASAALRRLAAGAPGARLAPQGTADLWLPIGPSVVLKGQAYKDPRVAGRVRDLAISENGKRAYAATANGGVWFTPDEGLSWAPLGNWIATPREPSTRVAQTALTCGCLHVTFGPGDDVDLDEVYVGTGELDPFQLGTPGARNGGVGVLRLRGTTTAAVGDPFGEHWEREAPNLAGFGIYRLVRMPAFVGQVMVAATSKGVFSRTGDFAADAEWVPVEDGPLAFDAGDGIIASDALLMDNGVTSRLVVAIYGKRTGVYYSENGIAGPFDEVRLPGLEQGRISLAHTGSGLDPDRLYVLGKGPTLHRVDFRADARPVVHEVKNVPRAIFGLGDDERSEYAMAIAVDPTDSETVLIAGTGIHDSDGQWNASLFRETLTPDAHDRLEWSMSKEAQEEPYLTGTWIGRGIHADVHRICLTGVAGALHGWIACDGGIFRSVEARARATYFSRNVGLAVLEGGYVASHPTSDQFVILGTQDNGVVQRVGDSVWLHTSALTGDGGGVAFHPTSSRYFAGQYTNAEWHGNDELWSNRTLVRRTFAPPVWRDRHEDSETAESDASSFYSGVDVQAASEGSLLAKVALGTHRVWVSEDWTPSSGLQNGWVTVPSGIDPRARRKRDVRTDVPDRAFGEVIATRWARDGRLFVLHARAVLVFTPPASAGTTRWERTVLSARFSFCGDFTDADVSRPSSPYLPPLGEWSDIALDHEAGGATTCYVACTGAGWLDGSEVVEATRMDTLWWFDGAGAWWATGLRNDDVPGSTGIAAPAFAVVVDPEEPTTVYVGTALGVWRGRRATVGQPTWTWSPLNNGLPEAAVQDLSLFGKRASVKLLRAAIQARGVWELDLSDSPRPVRCLFLRSHPNDARRVVPADLTNPTLGEADVWPWYISPDIKILRETTTPPWGAEPPTEADLFEHYEAAGAPLLVRAGPSPEFADSNVSLISPLGAFAAAYMAGDETLRVHVLVHSRDVTAVPAADVNVALFIRPIPATVEEWDGVRIDDDDHTLKQAITDLLVAPVPAPWDGSVGMMPADVASPRRSPAHPVDARTPRAVTFEVDMRGAASGHYLLLAVASATVDPVSPASLPGATVKDLVLESRHAGVRVVRKL
jgi:hypothetical protein